MNRTSGPNPVAATTYGRVEGVRRGGVCTFLGIPYGADTSGPNRFLPPRPPQPWPGQRAASSPGPAAPQTRPGGSERRNPWRAGGDKAPGTKILSTLIRSEARAESEDCLHLNVFTTGLRPSALRPVLVWLHGGGFIAGTASSAIYDATRLAGTTGAVVVAVNHRLGALGYCHLGKEGDDEFITSGNAGTLDQVAALRWVRDNIASFGGDPARVMIFGESGGGWKVDTLMAVPEAAGLFTAAASHSGANVTVVEHDRATELADALLHRLGVPDERAAQKLPGTQVMAAADAIQAEFDHRRLPNLIDGFAPVLDGEVVVGQPFGERSSELTRTVNMIVGYNRTEMTLQSYTAQLDPRDCDVLPRLAEIAGERNAETLQAISLRRHAGLPAARRLHNVLSDLVMAPFVAHILRSRASLPASTYSFRFDQETPALDGKLLSPHFLDVPYIFNNLALGEELTGPAGPAEQRLAEKMGASWVGLAECGDPAVPDGVGPWEPHRGPGDATILIASQCRPEAGVVHQDLDELSAVVRDVAGRPDILVDVRA